MGRVATPYRTNNRNRMTGTDIDVQIDEKVKQVVKQPDNFKVIIMNDDITPMDFVIDIICSVFKHTIETAKELTLKIHKEGSCVIAVYTYEIAEQKGTEVTNASRAKGYPLQVIIEKE